MNAHTPGPWRFYAAEEAPNGKPGVYSRYYSDEDVAVCGNHSKAWPLIEADARLIAAAPDLLEALKAALWNGCPVCCRPRDGGHDDGCQVVAAIAKAEGK